MNELLFYISVALTLCFAVINGFHDGGNVIATIVCSRSMHPVKALVGATVAEFLGPVLLGTAVAHTMTIGIIRPEYVQQLTPGNIYLLVIAGAGGAIIWNLATWFLGLPSSSSHALIGGLLGAGLVSSGIKGVAVTNMAEIVLLPLFVSPFIGIVLGFLVFSMIRIFLTGAPRSIGRYFVVLQVPSMLFLAGTHGSNDAQKSMGVILIVLAAAAGIKIEDCSVPQWVVLSCAAAVALGLSAGGWRMIKTVGYGICRLEPVHSFASQLTATTVILGASLLGGPVSTSQVVASSIMGVGASRRLSSVRWPVTANIAYAWILTVPISAALAAAIYWLLHRFVRV
ncbi:MAG: anion permease [Desulfomonilaceae bacterium]